jgi:hypothetical protein
MHDDGIGPVETGEDAAPALTAEKVFLAEKAGYSFDGALLNPYSPSRKVAAQSMGMIYPYVGEAAAAQMEATGFYAGAQLDCIILLWLCTIGDILLPNDRKSWTPSRALGNPARAREAAMYWAEANGLTDILSPKFQEAYNVFMAIANNADASEFHIEETQDGKGEAPNPP